MPTQRTPALPDVPTMGEIIPGFEASTWSGIGAPKGTPAAVIERLNREVNAGLQDQQLLKHFADVGATPIRVTPAELTEKIAKDVEKWAKVVKSAGIQRT
jgi:tripartite-type tricarboxylate transporter receptor subunit TctC